MISLQLSHSKANGWTELSESTATAILNLDEH